MTVAATAALANGSTTPASSYLTASRTPTPSRLNLLAVSNDVASGSVGTPAVTGCNLTWTLWHTQVSANGRRRLSLFRAKGVAPTAGQLTISFGGATQRSCRWVITEHEGTVSSGSEALVQHVGANGTDASAEVALAAFENTANATMFWADSEATASGSAEGAPLAFVTQSSNTWGRLRAGYYIGTDTTPDVTFPASGQWVAIGVELKALDQDEAGDPPSPWAIDVEIEGEVADEPDPPVDPGDPGEPPVIPPAPLLDVSQESLVVWVRDANLRGVDEITTKVSALTVVARTQAVGAWTLTVAASASPTPLLRADGAGIVVLYRGKVVLSGPVTELRERFDHGSAQLLVSGVSDLDVVARVQLWPQPADDTPPFDVDAYDVRAGPAESLMHAYVDANVGPSAPVSRQNPQLVFDADLARGATITYSARWDNTVDALAEMSVASGIDLCFGVFQDLTAADLVFRTWAPVDRSATAKFSTEQSNLAAYDYVQRRSQANFIIALGQGVGEARAVAIAQDPDSIAKYGRIEKSVDRRDLSDPTQLAAAANTAVIQAQATALLSITPIDTRGLVYGRDYELGDKVAIAVTVAAPAVRQGQVLMSSAGETMADVFYGDAMSTFGPQPPLNSTRTVEIVDVVRQVTFQLDSKGLVITPLVGTDPIVLAPNANLYQRLAALEGRTNRLEGV